MKVLVIGNGGREHALAWKAAQSSLVKIVFVAPGNAGTALEPKLQNISINPNDINQLVNFAQDKNIDLTIVGPEVSLVLGIVDAFHEKKLKIFGPKKAAAQLEGSKIFAKKFLIRHNIPTSNYESFSDLKSALSYVRSKEFPIVIKDDGLASGKGVVVAQTLQEAETAIHAMLSTTNILVGNSFSRHILVEDFLDGKEASFIVMVDEKKNILPMASSQDHKRLYDGDIGPNTGGMGAYSPTPLITDTIHQKVMNEIIIPTVEGMANEGNTYTGFLYVGLMIDKNGQPKVIEYNCRFGDPEAQTIMFRLRSDLINLCLVAIEGRLNQETALWDTRSALAVVLTTSGYPNNSSNKKEQIYGLPLHNQNIKDAKVFFSGTILKKDVIFTNGGRILCVTALGKDIETAQKKAYAITRSISWSSIFYRTDIGHQAILTKNI